MTVVAAPEAPDKIAADKTAADKIAAGAALAPGLTERVSSVRITPDNATVLKTLDLLGEFAGTWRGGGFNLIARPDFEDKTNLYLQLNQTRESLEVTPIGSAIPNRGFGMGDIELFGLTYLQKIADAALDGALHIEPGIWVIQPDTAVPPEAAPAGERLVARMGTIPHGNALLAQGVARPFAGFPTLKTATEQYAFSLFPSFNSTPFPTAPGPPSPIADVFNADGSSEKGTAQAQGLPAPGFFQYDLANAAGPTTVGGLPVVNTRTPYKTSPPEPPLPAAINGVPMQDVVNDPIRLLQAVVEQQRAAGCTFEGVALNIATRARMTFFRGANGKAGSPTVAVQPTNGVGGIENVLFLEGTPGASNGNADIVTVYATFWIEKVTPAHGAAFMQLQYAQMVVLNFPIFTALHPAPSTPPTPPVLINISWPHVSVATLRKTFN